MAVASKMKDGIQPAVLEELAQSTLDSFDERIAQLPHDLASPFQEEARTLEGQLLTIYKMVALTVRDEEDLDLISRYWDLMVGVCDRFSSHLARVASQQPHSGANLYHDRILDLRNKCRRLRDLHG